MVPRVILSLSDKLVNPDENFIKSVKFSSSNSSNVASFFTSPKIVTFLPIGFMTIASLD